jgi:hypothetical protein
MPLSRVHSVEFPVHSSINQPFLLVEIFNISETPINKGLLSSITQPRGATDVFTGRESKEGINCFIWRNPEKDELKFLHQQPYCSILI